MSANGVYGFDTVVNSLAAQERALTKSENRAFRLVSFCFGVAGLVLINVVRCPWRSNGGCSGTCDSIRLETSASCDAPTSGWR